MRWTCLAGFLKAAADPATTVNSAPIVFPGAVEFLELVRANSIMAQLARLRRVPFNRGMGIATGGGVFAWIAEGGAAPVGRLTWESASLPVTKAGGIIVFSTELLELAAPGSEDVMRAGMVEGMRTFMDTSLIDPTFAGVEGEAPASITNGITATPSTGDPSEDLRALLGGFTTLDNVAVIVSPHAAIAFATMLPAGAFANGLLFGFLPVIISSTAGDNLVAVTSRAFSTPTMAGSNWTPPTRRRSRWTRNPTSRPARQPS
jgi:hypothetical protein